MASFWGGPFTGIVETLRPTVANADEQAWLDQNQNPQPIDPLNRNQFDPNEYGLQTVKNDQTFQPEPGATLQEMLADRDLQFAAQPSLSQADSPLSFQYQNEEYPNSYGKSELYYDRQGPFSDKRQVADPDAYYNQVRTIGTPGDPFMGARDDTDAPFAKQSGDYYAGDYVNYNEPFQRPGTYEWEKGWDPTGSSMDAPYEEQEFNPMLMRALINSKNTFTPQNLGFEEESETISTPNITVAEELIDENRIPGRIQESVPNSQNWFERMMSGAKDKFSNLKMPPLGIMGIMNAIGNQFEDRQLTGDIMDESGYMYNAEALNKMNARGGYYTDPARSARRRTNRIRNMLNRQKANKNISTTNLQTLQKQVDDQNIHNIQQYTGKPVSQYRMDRPASERQFTGHGRSGMGRDPSDKMARGGRVGYSNGGLATLFTRRG